jgi:RHS repeat-associated protein
MKTSINKNQSLHELLVLNSLLNITGIKMTNEKITAMNIALSEPSGLLTPSLSGNRLLNNRKRYMRLKVLVFFVMLSIWGSFNAVGQTTRILDFNSTNGGNPTYNSPKLFGDVLYTTANGGLNSGGCIIKVNTDGSGYAKLYDFPSNAGNNSQVILSDGVLYGTTLTGGTSNNGCIFKINTDGTGYTTLLNFAGTSNGSQPVGEFVLSGNILYGVTSLGGTNNCGTIYKINTDGTGYAKLLDFSSTANGKSPTGSLTLLNGVLYGMTTLGGTNNLGTIFKINADGTLYTKLLDFSGTANGSTPYGSLIQSGGILYGMTSKGGTSSKGCIFKININGTGYTKMFDFSGVSNGSTPTGSLTLVNNVLYGMTHDGGTVSQGCIFKIGTTGTGFTTLFNLYSSNGYYPYGSFTLSNGFLYGMTYQGGANNYGCILRYQIPGYPQATIDRNAQFCAGKASGPSITCAGGTAPYTVNYDFNNGTSTVSRNVTITYSGAFTLTVTEPGIYTLRSMVDQTFGNVSIFNQSSTVTLKPLPAAAGVITGDATVVQGQSGHYSVSAIANADDYIWNLPPGATIGAFSTNTEINVDFSLAAVSGNISVYGSNFCGSGAPSANFPVTVNSLPADAGTITGTATVCGGQSTVSYYVPPIDHATSYAWAYSGSGATINGTTNSITIDFAANASSGSLTVYGVNASGTGTVSANYPILVNGLPVNEGPGNWTRKNDMPLEVSMRAGQFSCSNGMKAYFGTGWYNGTQMNDFWEYDKANDTWTRKADFPIPRTNAICFAIGNKIYAGLGQNSDLNLGPGFFPYNDFWEYDIPTDTWTQKAEFPGSGRIDELAFTIGNHGYICFGNASVGINTDIKKDVWEYSPETDTWTQKTDFPGNPREGVFGFIIGDKGYVGGGINGFNPWYKDFWEYDPSIDVWTQKADFEGSISVNKIGFSINGKGYAGLGQDTGGSFQKDFWEYDPKNNHWSRKADFIGERVTGIYFSIGNSGYVGMGASHDFWEFNTSVAPITITSQNGSIVCKGQTGVAYNISAVSNATSYTWSYSGTGATINGTTNAVTIDFAANATSGNLTVKGINSCGDGAVSQAYAISVTSLSPAAPGMISGAGTVCQGQKAVPYNLPAIANATGYIWNLPVGATIVSGDNINSIIVDYSATAISGNISVYGTNGCGNGTLQNLAVTVNTVPLPAGPISGTAIVCQGQSSVSYSIPSIVNADSYVWTYSGDGATINGSSNAISINFAANATSGTLAVHGNNACGNGSFAFYPITVNLLPANEGPYTWKKKNDLPGNIRFTGAEDSPFNRSFSNGVYGFNFWFEGSTQYLSVYNPGTDAWTTITPFPDFLDYTESTCFTIGNKIYIFIGEFNGFWEYDMATGVWTRKADAPDVGFSYNHIGFVIGSKGYIGTAGQDYNVHHLWEYDPALDTWTRKADFLDVSPSGYYSARGLSIGSKGYIFDDLNHILMEYDLVTDHWERKADYPGIYWFTVAFPMGGKIYAGGGGRTNSPDANENEKNKIWEYDPGTNQWSLKTTFPGLEGNAGVGFSIGNKAYVGAEGESNFWEYSPDVSVMKITSPSGTPVCQGQTEVTYSVPEIKNATSYEWAYSGTGATINGSTNTITIDFTSNATSGNLTVHGVNACGNGVGIAPYAITVNPLPIVGPISGVSIVSPGQTGVIYSVPNVAGLTGYVWSLPYGATITSANNLNSITVDFSNDAVSGNISVYGTNGCGNGTPADFPVTVSTIEPPIITSPVADQTVCENVNATFSITATGATSYNWQESADGVNWTDIPNATNATYTLSGTTSNNGHHYHCIVTGSGSITSNAATLTVSPLPTVTGAGTWTNISNFPFASDRKFGMSCSTGGKGYIGLGWIGGYLKDFWEYDPILNTWTSITDFAGAPRDGAISFTIGNKIYVGLGYNNSFLTDFWEYDITLSRWTKKSDFPGEGRGAWICFSIGNKGYLGTGLGTGSKMFNDFWEYDPSSDHWTRKTDVPGENTFNCAGFSVGNKGYIVNAFSNNVWAYDPLTGAWTQMANFVGSGRQGAASFSIGDKAYMGLGDGKNDMWEYDFYRDSWTQKTNLTEVKLVPKYFSIGSLGYVLSGLDANEQVKNDFWKFNPSAGALTITSQNGNSVCQGQTGIAYSIPAIANATSYAWSYSGTGATINGTANSITIDFAANATSGNLTVHGVNACGNGIETTPFAINVNSLPNVGPISGMLTVSQGQTGVTYSVPVVAGATGYVWNLPYGATITSANNLNSITVDFSNDAVSGNISVYGTNGCGNGIPAEFPVTVTSVVTIITSQPANQMVCENVNATFSITASNALSFKWQESTDGINWTDIPNASNSTYIVPGTANNNGHHYHCIVTGSGSVTSNSALLTVNLLPVAAGTITGSTLICKNQTAVPYNVPPITNATGYTWSLPSGATIAMGANSPSIKVDYSSAATSGNVSVYGTNSCGNGTPSANLAVTVNPLPTAPTATATQNYCSGLTVASLTSTPPSGCVTDWYSASSGGSAIPTSTSLISGTYYGQSRNTTTGCTSSTRTAVTVTLNALPVAGGTITGTTTLCQGQTAVPYSVPPITNATGYTWTLPAGASIATGANSPSITVDYSASSTSGNVSVYGTNSCGNGTPSANLAVTVNPLPTAPTATAAQNYCGGLTVASLISTPPSGCVTDWYSASTGGSAIPTSTLLTSGTYYGESRNTTSGCISSTRTAVTVTVNASPAAPTATATQNYCGGLTVASLISTPPSGCVTDWYSASTGGSAIPTSTLLTSGTYYGESRNTTSGCISSTRTAVTVTLNALPVAGGTITGTTTLCQGQTAVPYSVPPITNATGYTWNLPSGATIATGANSPSIIVDYSAAATSGNVSVYGTNSCGNGTPSASLAVTVNPSPAAPTATATQNYCGGLTVASLASTPPSGCVTDWYSVSTGGSAIPSGTSLTSGTYYGESRNTTSGCISSTRTAVTVTVNALPSAPTATAAQNYCGGLTVASLTSTPPSGCVTDWYNASTGGSAIPSGTSLTSGTYYGESRNTTSGCISSTRTAVTVTLNALPSVAGTITGTTTLCQGQTGVAYSVPAITNATGYTWSLPTGATIATGSNTNNITVNYSTSAQSGDVSVYGTNSCGNGTPSANLAVTVNPIPADPIALSMQNYCKGSTVASLTSTIPTGCVADWYSTLGGTALPLTTELINGTYYCQSRNTTTGCVSNAKVAVSVTLTALPSVAGNIIGTSNICLGQTSVSYSVPGIPNATGYHWDLPTGATIATGSNTKNITVDYSTSAVSGNISVYGTNSCGNGTASSLSVTVNPLPAAPSVTATQNYCSGLTVTSLTSTPPSGCVTDWYSTSTEGAVLPTTTILTNGTYYGQSRNTTTGCTSSTRTSVTVTLNPLPAAAGTITGTTTLCQGQTGVAYSVPAITNATGYTWSLPTGATIATGSNTNNITVDYSSSSISGNVSVFGANNCGNGTASNLPVTVNPLPAAPTASSTQNYCNGLTVASLTSTPSLGCVTDWYNTPTGSSALPTSTILINGTYYGESRNSATGCISSTRTAVAVTLDIIPGAAGDITGNTTVCQGNITIRYSVGTIAGATSYHWNLPAGTTITSGNGGKNITLDFAFTATDGKISVYGINSCGNGPPSPELAITVNPIPVAPTAISDQTFCSGATIADIAATAPSGSAVEWYGVPTSGGIIPGSLLLTTRTYYAASRNTTTACISNTRTPVNTIINPLPDAAGSITGSATVNQGQTGVVYSILPIANATEYVWSLPSGVSISSGDNTNSIIVDFSNAASGGNISVYGKNSCGVGTPSNFPVTIKSADPPVITSQPANQTLCDGSTATFSISAINDNSYLWQQSADGGNSWSDIAGTNSLTYSIPTNPLINGYLYRCVVTGTGGSVISNAALLTVNLYPEAAGIVTGTTTVCQGQTSVLYSVPAITNATGYSWTLPDGATIATGANSRSIMVDYSASATSGNVSVYGTNGSCKGSPSGNFAVTVNPLWILPKATTPDGPASLCITSGTATYTTTSVDNALSYEWILTPSSAGTITNNGLNAVITWNTAYTGSAQVQVRGVSTCSLGTYSNSLTVSIFGQPVDAGAITGPISACIGSNAIYTVQAINNASSYVWDVPSGAHLVSTPLPGEALIRFDNTFNQQAIRVHGHNAACGDGANSPDFLVDVNPLPDGSFTGLIPNHFYCLNDGPITLTPATSGGVFSGHGISGNKFNPAAAGRGTFQITYSVVANGCEASSTQDVVVTAPIVDIPNLVANYCIDATPFTLQGTPNTGGNYSFTLDGKSYDNTSPEFNPASLGLGTKLVKYEFTETATGCSNSVSRAVYIHKLPTVNITATEKLPICAKKDVHLMATPSDGQAPYSFKWSPGGQKQQMITFQSVATHMESVTVTDVYGCSGSNNLNIEVLATPSIAMDRSQTLPVTCPDIADGRMSFTVNYTGSGDLSYFINPHNTSPHTYPMTTTAGSTITPTDLSMGYQSIKVVSNATGCEDNDFEYIRNGGPSVYICAGPALCNYDGIGTSPVRFTINVTRRRPSPIGTFAYTITGKDVNYSGTGNYGAEFKTDAINVWPGEYYEFHLAKDADNTCNVAATRVLIRNAVFNIKFDRSDRIYKQCLENEAKSVTVTTTMNATCMELDPTLLNYRLRRNVDGGDPVTVIDWTTADSKGSTTFSDLTVAGIYLVDVRYNNIENCIVPAQFEIKAASVLKVDVSSINVKCNGSATGEAIAVVTGNEAPAIYKWYQLDGSGKEAVMSNSATAEGLAAGTYHLNVTDPRGCTVNYNGTVTITEPPALTVPQILWEDDPCHPKAELSGGTAGYTFYWYKRIDPFMMTTSQLHFQAINQLFTTKILPFDQLNNTDQETEAFSQPAEGVVAPGTYKVKVVDANGCIIWSPYTTIAPKAGDREYALTFRWKTKMREKPQVNDQIDDNTLNTIDPARPQPKTDEQVKGCIDLQIDALREVNTNLCKTGAYIEDAVAFSYPANSYYYTLYYYDRAGNLVRTVAPEGVKLVNSIADIPAHTFTTNYAYNNFDQLMQQGSADDGISRFIYNNKGQARFSQNARQAIDKTCSYTKYNYLGRIIEAGECSLANGLTYNYNLAGKSSSMSINTFDDLHAIAELDNYGFNADDGITCEQRFPSSDQQSALSQQTITVYSIPGNVNYNGNIQRFLLNRTSQVYTLNKNGDKISTYYSYDPNGNVEWVVQDIPMLGRMGVAYEYDLISDKVLKVKMNENRNDAFFHKYDYYEDNRIQKTFSSANGVVWENDATYSYYDHGPVKRIEFGQDKVQGMDYSYTLNGWIKAFNTPDLLPLNANEDKGFAPDKFGMVLGYYDGDFVKAGSTRFTSGDVFALKPSNNTSGTMRNLYNGNISSWVTNGVSDIGTADKVTGFQYSYDKLNRIKGSNFNVFNSGGFGSTDDYKEAYTFDLNGNILSLDRNGYAPKLAMDNLGYNYYPGTNKLNHITDIAPNPENYNIDIKNQDNNNYEYDAIGNLVRDNQAGNTILWTVLRKVAEVRPDKATDPGKQKPHIVYSYDAAGNRIKKQVNHKPEYDASGIITGNITDPEAVTTTFYLRDASGNTMAVYERYNHLVNGHYEAVFALSEVPLYGSDRLGMYKTDISSPLAVIPFQKADFDQVKLDLDKVIALLPGTQTWAAASQKTETTTGADPVSYTAALVNKALYNPTANYYNITEEFINFTGNITGTMAVAEDESNTAQFFVVPSLINNTDNVLAVYNRSGILMPNGDNLNFKPGTQCQVTKAIGGTTDEYFVFSVGTDGKLYYHRVDMTLTAGLGDFTSKNQLLDNTNANYNGSLLAIEDNGKQNLKLLATRYSAVDKTLELVRFEFNNTLAGSVTPTVLLTLNNSYGAANLQLSPDGKQLLVYHFTGDDLGFGVYPAELLVYNIDCNKTDVLGTPVETMALPEGTIAGSSADYTATGKAIVYSQTSLTGQQTNMYSLSSGTSSKNLLASTTGDVTLRTDGRMYLSQAGQSSMVAYEQDMTSNFAVTLGSTLTGSLAQKTFKAQSAATTEHQYARISGLRLYELKDHLGNVRVVFTDLKSASNQNGNLYNDAKIKAYYNYYPFGMQLPGRYSPSSQVGQNGYRYGFNGKEKDDDFAGSTSAIYDYGFRIYDSRIGRFLSMDPLTQKYPWYSPYQFAGNLPIWAEDLDGLEPKYAHSIITNEQKHYSGKIMYKTFTAYDIDTKETYQCVRYFNAYGKGKQADMWYSQDRKKWESNEFETYKETRSVADESMKIDNNSHGRGFDSEFQRGVRDMLPLLTTAEWSLNISANLLVGGVSGSIGKVATGIFAKNLVNLSLNLGNQTFTQFNEKGRFDYRDLNITSATLSATGIPFYISGPVGAYAKITINTPYIDYSKKGAFWNVTIDAAFSTFGKGVTSVVGNTMKIRGLDEETQVLMNYFMTGTNGFITNQCASSAKGKSE